MSTKCEDTENINRGKWNRKVEYFLTMLGYTVALGNLWRFPYICLRNGGGAFLIPYVICLLLFGLPLFFLETAAGQFSAQGLIHVWEVCPIFKGVGVGMTIANVICGIYYNIILGWTIYYLGNSFIDPLPWTTCNNKWNTPQCVVDRGVFNKTSQLYGTSIVDNSNTTQYITNGTNISKISNKLVTAQEEFWQNNVLQMSSGINDLGTVNWKILLCVLGGWILIGLCIIKGVKSVGKVVYVTATLPYILLTIVLIRGLTLDGGVDGVKQYLQPDFGRLLNTQVWMEAAIQVFYSLGAAWGPLFTMASFNKFNNNCLKDAVILSFAGEGTSVYAGLIIYTVLGFMSTKFSVPLKDVVKPGPGLVFIVYPEALAQLPGKNVWSVLFFITLLTVGLDSQFAYCESVIVGILDSFPKLRKYYTTCVIATCILQFLFGIIIVTQGGIYIFQIVDWYIAAFGPVVYGIIECLVFGWIYGMSSFSRDVKLMIGKGIPRLLKVCICVVTPIILLVFLIYSIIAYQPPTYGTYVYPSIAVGFGIFLAVAPLLSVIICAVIVVQGSPGTTLKDKFYSAIRPTQKWKPSDKTLQSNYYDDLKKDHPSSVYERVKMNILG